MDSIGGARIAVDQIGFAPIDSLEDELRALRRERDALRRENRVLKIAVVELERVSERDTLTPLFNRRYFLTRSEEHTSELQSLMRISYAVFCLKKKKRDTPVTNHPNST